MPITGRCNATATPFGVPKKNKDNKTTVPYVRIPSDCALPIGTSGLIKVTFDPNLGATKYLRFSGAYLYVDVLTMTGVGKVFGCAAPELTRPFVW